MKNYIIVGFLAFCLMGCGKSDPSSVITYEYINTTSNDITVKLILNDAVKLEFTINANDIHKESYSTLGMGASDIKPFNINTSLTGASLLISDGTTAITQLYADAHSLFNQNYYKLTTQTKENTVYEFNFTDSFFDLSE